MQNFDAPKRDKHGKIVNADDAEARQAARERKQQRQAAKKAAKKAEEKKAQKEKRQEKLEESRAERKDVEETDDEITFTADSIDELMEKIESMEYLFRNDSMMGMQEPQEGHRFDSSI